jgi:hypothetical protein
MYRTLFLWWVGQKRKFQASFVHIRQLLWFHVRLRGNDFHPSLQLNAKRRSSMTQSEQDGYDLELTRRRSLARELELKNEDLARTRLANTKT